MNTTLLTSVFLRLRSGLKAKAKFILGNDDDADDALQEAFCRLWSSRARITDESHAEGMAYTTVKNISIDMYRQVQNHQSTDINSLKGMAEEPEAPDCEEMMKDVNRLIDQRLTQRDKEILYKREMYGYEFEELAEIYQLTPGNVRAIVSRGRKAIREEYLNNAKLKI